MPTTTALSLPTYPARPVNGGPIEVSSPKHGVWYAEPKYNGWRAFVHVPSLKEWLDGDGAEPVFGRHGQHISIAGHFREVLQRIAPLPFQWLDVEGLSRRHAIAKGTLIILDHFDPRPEAIDNTYEERRWYIDMVCALAKIPKHDQLHEAPEPDSLYLVASYKGDAIGHRLYEVVRKCNEALKKGGEDFYEGIVMKQSGSIYPNQLRDPERTTPTWIKHRWHF